MSMAHGPTRESYEPGRYEIRVKGHLDPRGAAWFEGFSLTQEVSGDTLLSGEVIDQAALHGLLKKIRDLGMILISINRIDPTQSDDAAVEE